ncbi:isovaleryl-CoA dehydrogenase [Silvimonas amylolytica]|uniref:DNA alkylation response protein n=1 Tax=Silvimonas amylolytica TaxID=449663 RepID=A0ABQ2PIZ3_9NEIS|nr:isovaleryl-CoA dehydrogenase [Silvimonas amylolytica]GGP24944.1 DNA alkylation response protein [Silvimonas amylolytica]
MTRNTPNEDSLNQPRPLNEYNLFLADLPLREALAAESPANDYSQLLTRLGARLGTPETFELGRRANQHKPALIRYDAGGRRIDRVDFDPAWHRLMSEVTASRLHNGHWGDPDDSPVARAVRFMLHAQVEAGTLCPVTMTYGAVPVLQRTLMTENGPCADWLSPLLSPLYDSSDAPATAKRGVLIGMGMTEKQGGSDVRANTSEATPAGNGMYRLNGHKWFFSVPQSDAHLVLAQAAGGLSCFLLPRVLPDGQRNGIALERLKDKLGNRSNASSEVEFHNALGWLVGEEGKGGRTILEMGGHTRFDCALGSTGLMRRALSLALYHARHRRTFGKVLIEHPLMACVLADLALELEGYTALLLRLARWRRPQAEPHEQALARILTPAAKYLICKRGAGFVVETMEILGGNGYIEESDLPRIYREMPVNAIWEGSGNIMALDVMRALAKEPQTRDALENWFAPLARAHPAFAVASTIIAPLLATPEEHRMRDLAERIVHLACAAVLLENGNAAIADAWCLGRLNATVSQYGAQVREASLLLKRALPAL